MAPDGSGGRRDSAIRHRPRWLLLIAALLALIIIAALWPVAQATLSMRKHLLSAKAILEHDPAAVLHPVEREELLSDFQTIESDVVLLQARLAPVLAASDDLGWIPVVGDTLVALPDMLGMARELSAAAVALVDSLNAFDDLMTDSSAGQTPPETITQRLLGALELAQPQFGTASERIEKATAARQTFSGARLVSPLVPLFQSMDAYLPLLSTGVQVLQSTPDLMGANGPRTYLLVAQNSDELRATGGFISGIGTLTMIAGEIAELGFQDSYAVEDWSKPHPDPPAPLRKHMLADLWTTRDANWWPDFPTSAKAILELYALNQGVQSDGVIAVDMRALELIVAALEPITLKEKNETITAGNIRERIYAFWDPPPLEGPLPTDWRDWSPEVREWWAERKDFMPVLTTAILERVQDFSSLDLGDLSRALSQALDQKHILLYFADPRVQSVLELNGWDASVEESAGDYLMIVDSNLGFNKSNAAISQRISYEVDLRPDGGPIGEVLISYRHRSKARLSTCDKLAQYEVSYEALIDKCYWDYVRVYTPPGCTLLEVEGSDDHGVADPEAGKQVFSAYFVLAPGESKQLRFRYTLPETVRGPEEHTDDHYHLLVQKQPGTLAIPLEIRVRLPLGVEATECTPASATISSELAEFEAKLGIDRIYDIALQQRP